MKLKEVGIEGKEDTYEAVCSLSYRQNKKRACQSCKNSGYGSGSR